MRIGIIAGELSGDQLGEGVVKAFYQRYPEAIIEGIAGPKMQAAGCRSLFPMETLSVMGFGEVVAHLPSILRVRRGIISHFIDNPPDIFIGIDAPDFNLYVEKQLKQRGIRTAHYVSPSVWAWREGRMKKIKAATDVVFAILPFEGPFYSKHEHRAVFVGHPLARKIPITVDKAEARLKLNIDVADNQKLIALLPGSRKQEVTRLLPVFLQALKQLRLHYDFKIVLPIAKSSLNSIIAVYQNDIEELGIKVVEQQSHLALEAADMTLIASGTATLEAMLYKTPMVVAYKVSWLTEVIAKRLLKISSFSLPNILAGEAFIPEYIQHDCTAGNLAMGLRKYFDDIDYYSDMVEKFSSLHQQLVADTDQRIMDEVANLLAQK